MQSKAARGIAREHTAKTHLAMGFNLKGSMDGRLEAASESRREDLRLDGGGAMVSSG